MNDSTPHYLLMSETSQKEGLGHWRFLLRPMDGSPDLVEADVEPDTCGERLDLLTVVRGLEALDQPSRVTLVACTRYVEQGVMYGLAEWRENDWQWEYYGHMAPVRDADLWQRMDRIVKIHRVDCGHRRHDQGHPMLSGPHWNLAKTGGKWVDRIARGDWIKYSAPALATWCGLWVALTSRVWHLGARWVMGCCSSLILHRS
jgi:ribonuclease HI